MLPRILSGLVGLLMLVTAVGWITDPASAAAGLGMPLLDGLGRTASKLAAEEGQPFVSDIKSF